MSLNDHALFQIVRSFTVLIDRAKKMFMRTSENRGKTQISEKKKLKPLQM